MLGLRYILLNHLTIEMSQPVVKGITHCLLPDCNDLTWPFMNYCGRTHADEGKKKGLIGKTILLLQILKHKS